MRRAGPWRPLRVKGGTAEDIWVWRLLADDESLRGEGRRAS